MADKPLARLNAVPAVNVKVPEAWPVVRLFNVKEFEPVMSISYLSTDEVVGLAFVRVAVAVPTLFTFVNTVGLSGSKKFKPETPFKSRP